MRKKAGERFIFPVTNQGVLKKCSKQITRYPRQRAVETTIEKPDPTRKTLSTKEAIEIFSAKNLEVNVLGGKRTEKKSLLPLLFRFDY